MKKRILLLLVGLGCLKISINVFPRLDILSFQFILQKLIFHPFNWLGAIFLFICGFLAIARVVKGICEQKLKRNGLKKEWPWIAVIALLFFYIGVESWLVAVLAIGFSLFYGIMDANLKQKNRYYNS